MSKARRIITFALILALLLGSKIAAAEEKLIFAVTLIRHGDRTPCHSFAACPYDWTPGIGELTPLGMHQEYLLGQSLRTRYVEELRLLPQRYHYNSIYVRATNYNRTIMSAMAFLCGLYPPGTGPLLDDGKPALPAAYQLIPLRTMPVDQDRLLHGQDISRTKIEEMVRTHVFTTAEWRKMNASHADKFDRWSRIYGVRIENLGNLIEPGDDLNVRLLKGVPLPGGLTEAEAREIVTLSQWAMAQKLKPRQVSRPIMAYFMRELINDMQKAIDGKQEYKFILFSAHDNTILAVMAALGIPLEATPPYAANVCFELYRAGDGQNVKVRYNGKDIALPDTGGRTTCTFEQFRKAVLDDEVSR
jgi:hypothetical protein